jgi:predicted PolB exonuclease-like 3'-5' exonuclease
MNNLAELYKKEERSISEFIDKNHDLPSAVIGALYMRLYDLSEHIKFLDSLEDKNVKTDNVENDPDVEV